MSDLIGRQLLQDKLMCSSQWKVKIIIGVAFPSRLTVRCAPETDLSLDPPRPVAEHILEPSLIPSQLCDNEALTSDPNPTSIVQAVFDGFEQRVEGGLNIQHL